MHELASWPSFKLFDRMRSSADKLRWGLRVVGLRETLNGLLRMAALKLQRPPRAEVKLRSGPVLEFVYPSQLPPVLVVFGDLIDPEFAFLREVARPGWVYIDVGAAIGQFSLFAATLGSAEIHAVEPSGSNIATLRRNLARNGAASVKVHHLALSTQDGEARFATAAKTWMSQLGQDGGEVVKVRTLTGLMEDLGLAHVSVLKLNVAGYEPAVLEGGREYLAAGRVDVLILLLGLASLRWYQSLFDMGYRFFYYHPLQRSLHEVTAFDEHSVLDHRPWPARHIIAIRDGAIRNGLLDGLAVRRI